MIQPAFTVFATITTSPNLHVGINLDRCYINMEFASKGSLHNGEWFFRCLVAVQRRWEIARPWKLPRLVSPVANDFFRKWMEVQPSRRATAADLLKHLFVAPHRVVRSVIPLCPDQMYCPPAVIRYARRLGGPMMMMMTMAPPRPGDLIC
ncbi:hypothetical protein YC2023_012141 [Brassica napus]